MSALRTPLPADAIEQWYADGPADSKDQRLLDMIFIAPHVGACTSCMGGAGRVRAEFEFWETVLNPASVCADDCGPYTSCQLLCNRCVIEQRGWPEDPEIPTVLIRRMTTLTIPVAS